MAGGGPLFDFAGGALGLREGVIALIALVALYMLVVLLRMRRLRNKKAAASAPRPVESVPAAVVATEPTLDRNAEQAAEAVDEEEIPWNEPPPAVVNQALAQEVVQLRDEVDALRGELAALRADMLHELSHMRAAQTVSPLYNDAMQMALSGYEPAMIAERCGIARAEAELVVALAKSQTQ